MSILIRNGRVITADLDLEADVYVDGETISAFGRSLDARADRVIDASGMYVIPGGVDVHTHLDMPFCGTVSSDDFATGTRAAAFGGTTCLIDFAIQARGTSMRAALDVWLRKGEKAVVDYGLHMIVTEAPASGQAELDEMVIQGVTSFKLFMAYPDTLMADDDTILRVLRRSTENGSLVCIHAENGTAIEARIREAIAAGNTAPIHHALTRPAAVETNAVQRAIALAQKAGAAVYIVHLSTADALEAVALARGRGLPVFAETCPQYLLLSIDDLRRPDFEGAKYVFSPPAREKRDQERLWLGLRERTLEVVATDHCPVFLEEKLAAARRDFTRIPNGGPGIENRLQLLFHFGVNLERISVQRWVELVATAPAKMFGLYPRKGTIAAGSDADIVVWNPGRELTISARTHHMRVDYSMYEGYQVKGNAETVLSRGEVIVENGMWIGRAGRGRFVKRGHCDRCLNRNCRNLPFRQ
jgi:dihydropyrimidinase